MIAVTAAIPDVVSFHGQCNKSLELESSYMSENLVLISFFKTLSILASRDHQELSLYLPALRIDDASYWCHNIVLKDIDNFIIATSYHPGTHHY